jgi:hypothetical protein
MVKTAVEVYPSAAVTTYMIILSPNAELHGFVNGSRNNVILLFLREFNEVNCITGNTDGELRILFRMSLCIQKGFAIEYVYVKVIATVANVAV